MIAGIFHKGSGLGNQLHRYVGSYIAAFNRFEDHGMVAPELFKGHSFIKLPMTDAGLEYEIQDNTGKTIIKDLRDVIVVDAEFQSELYFANRLEDIRYLLKVEPITIPDDVCVINFRGGEYVGVRDLFLPEEYWDLAIQKMLVINPDMKFEVHTDDPETARCFFPSFPIIKDIGINWRSIRYAKYLILSNSSFAIIPAILGDAKEIIAPKYWAGYNKGYWQLEDNNYKRFTYIHHENI